MNEIEKHGCFGGSQSRYQHESTALNCTMHFSVFLPPLAKTQRVPFLIWLSGLTGRDETFAIEAGAQRYAAEHNIAIVMPDTSPRGEDVPDDPEGAYDFGHSAGFYLNATQAPWSTHYNMYRYVVEELSELVLETLPLDADRQSIFGHSMGGHGALSIAFKNPGRFRSVSALAPISNPSNCPWGEKAFTHYLGSDRETWKEYDSTELVQHTEERLPLLIHEGSDDEFLEKELKLNAFEAACKQADYPATIVREGGYDHGYYFVASFVGEHIAFHAKHLIT
jgi:S-formylglutathione hydrolase